MRRLIIADPVSRYAVWSPRFAWFGAAVTAIGVAIVRYGSVEVGAGLAVIGAGLVFALVAVALSICAGVMIWSEGHRGVRQALAGLIVGLAALGWPAVMAVRAVTLPQLADISTDLADPPSYSRSAAALAARQGTTPPDVAADRRAAQTAAYPLVAPLYVDLTPEEAFATATSAAESLGWRIVESQKPTGKQTTGRFEAIAHTPLLRLPEDLSVRIKPGSEGTQVDVRSVSRFGAHDLGENAQRITSFLDKVSEDVSADEE